VLYIGLLFSSVANCKFQLSKTRSQQHGYRELQHIEPLSVVQPPCRNAAYS